MKFKIGDWVTTSSGETKQITGFSGEQGSTIIHSDGFMCYASDCELWQPKEGEYCWFWNNNEEETAVVSKFIEMDATGSYKSSIVFAHCYISFDFCEPFIGELPSFLKE